MIGLIISVTVLTLIVIGLVFVVRIVDGVRDTVEMISPIAQAIKEGGVETAEEIARRPKSVSGMTNLCMPRIAADFPEFNWYEFKAKSEKMLRSALKAVTAEDISILEEASSDLRSQLLSRIAENRDKNQHEICSDIEIHQTEIKEYKKQNGTCIIVLQSSVGYMHYYTKAGEIISGSDQYTEQTRFNIELVYVQDADRVSNEGKSFSLTCESCGAPIKSLGEKTCPYCGCHIEAINTHVWSFNKLYEA